MSLRQSGFHLPWIIRDLVVYVAYTYESHWVDQIG